MTVQIKICGITNKEDALNAVSLGVNALGFIFYEQSPRFVTPELVEEISYFLPPFVTLVGVYVNQSREFIKETVTKCRLDVVQLHGDETPTFCLSLNERVIKAIRVEDPHDLSSIVSYQGAASAILLDTKVKGAYGGTGKTFDWGLAIQAKEYDIPLIVSGGVHIGNIVKAISLIKPYAIDLSSGVESEPGCKDYHKMQEFMLLARES